MQAHQALNQLLHSLRSHKIELTGDDVGWAFQAKNTQEDVTNWVQQYLGKETLLSCEEAELFSTLERNGTARRIAAGYDLETVESFPDEEIGAALSSLEKATLVITEQTLILKLQRTALSEFQAGYRQTQIQSKRTAGLRQRNRLQEKQNIDLAIEELLQTLIQNATHAQNQLRACHNAYPNRIAKALRQDDETLRKLDEMSAAARPVDGCEEHQKDRLEKLCARLTANTVDETRCRLDRKYLEAIQSSRNLKEPQSIQANQANELVSSIKAELETLYPEISAVALMSIDQTFKSPLAKNIEQSIIQREDQILTLLNHIDTTLSYIQERAAQLITRLLTHDSHLVLLNTVVNEVQNLYPDRNQSITTMSSPAAKQDSPSILPSKSIPVNNIDSAAGEEWPEHLAHKSHRQLLQALGVPPLGSSNWNEIQSTLDTVISNRQQKTKMAVRALNQAIDLSLSTALNDATSTNSLLMEGLLEDAEFHSIDLLSPHLKSRQSKLLTEIDRIGSEMRGLDLDKEYLASKKQEDFVKQWST